MRPLTATLFAPTRCRCSAAPGSQPLPAAGHPPPLAVGGCEVQDHRPGQLRRARHQPARRGLRGPALVQGHVGRGGPDPRQTRQGHPETFEDGKTPTWFVPVERRDEFKKDEIERLPEWQARASTCKGTFILHLSGIDREKSASYYTPEVLTKCLVEEALRELLKDYGPEDADKILELTICEPAMGSGAFLNEATEQLAERYLELKQEQLGGASNPRATRTSCGGPSTSSRPATSTASTSTRLPSSWARCRCGSAACTGCW